MSASALPPPLAAAAAAHRAGDLLAAESAYWQVLDADADNAEALHGLGTIQQQKQQSQAALQLMERAAQLDPDRPAWLADRAMVLETLKRDDEALRLLERACELDADYLEGWLALGRLRLTRGDAPGATEAYMRAVVAHPQAAKAYFGLALASRAAKDDARALWALQRAQALAPDDADAALEMADLLASRGELGPAEAGLRELLARQPRLHQAYNNLGVLLRRKGDLAGAEAALREAMRLSPRYLHAYNNLGNVLAARGRASEAVECYQWALSLDPKFVDALVNLCGALLDSGDRDAALDCARQAVGLEAHNAAAQHALGLALRAAGDAAGARAAWSRAVELDPANAESWNNLGVACRDQEDHAGAESAYRRALALRPDYVMAWNNLGNALKNLARVDEAIDAFEQALRIDPDYVEAYNNLGVLLQTHGEPERAIESYRAALARRPDLAEAWANMSVPLRELGEYDAAIDACRRALALREHYFDAWNNLGNALQSTARLDESVQAFDAALALRDDADTRWNKAFSLLLGGHFSAGWDAYLGRPARQKVEAAAPGAFDTALPEDLHGKTVMLRREQGLGDELFFLRYVPLLAARGATLLGKMSPKMIPLLARTDLFADLATDEPSFARPIDRRVMVGDLPRIFGMGDGDLPPPALRLTPLPERVAALRARLEAAGPRPWIGVTWRAGTSKDAQRGRKRRVLFKEAPLDDLAAALHGRAGAWVVLQRNPEAGEVAQWASLAGSACFDASELNADLDDMLALLSLLDEHVGVSNTNMHLAASLGKTARVLVPYPPEWRWMVDGLGFENHSPWFAGFTVYRQSMDGDWGAALARLAAALDAKSSIQAEPPG
jgi:tetratricopeptide (TPR) repeat protein